MGLIVTIVPPGLGRQPTVRVCSGCNELAPSISLHQDRDGSKAVINKMISLGAQESEQDFSEILGYLAQNYPADAILPLNVKHRARSTLRAG